LLTGTRAIAAATSPGRSCAPRDWSSADVSLQAIGTSVMRDLPFLAVRSTRPPRWQADLDAHEEIHADGGLTIEDVNQIQVGERANEGGGGFQTEHDGVGKVASGGFELETRVTQAAVYQDEAIAEGGD